MIRKYAVELINPDTGCICYFTGAFPFFSLQPVRCYSFKRALCNARLLKVNYPNVMVVAVRE